MEKSLTKRELVCVQRKSPFGAFSYNGSVPDIYMNEFVSEIGNFDNVKARKSEQSVLVESDIA